MEQFDQLSNREREVVELLRQGKSNKEIASELTISVRTVEFHLKNIYAKYEVRSRVELILKLESATGRPESEKLGYSTVAEGEELPKNRDGFNSQMNWVTSLRETVSRIGKKLDIKEYQDANPGDDTGPMAFHQAILVCLAKYAEFNGRASRAEFWWFFLFVILVSGGLAYLSEALSSVFLVAILLPLLAVGARRLRDIGKSPWWLLYLLVPVGGIVILAYLWALPPMNEILEEKLPA